MSEWLKAHAWKACESNLRRRPGPRNHLCRHEEVASFWRPFRLLGDGHLKASLAMLGAPRPWPATPLPKLASIGSPSDRHARWDLHGVRVARVAVLLLCGIKIAVELVVASQEWYNFYT